MSPDPSSLEPELSGRLPERAGPLSLLVLVALTAIAGWMRLEVANLALPARQIYDERFLLDELELVRDGSPSARADPAFGVYPQLLPRLAMLAGSPPAQAGATSLEAELARASRDLLSMRRLAALLAALAVPATWLVARRFLEPRLALLAAALIATSVLQVWYSAQARPHAPSSGAIVLALAAALAIRSRGRPADYAFAALATVLAIGSSQAGISVLPSLLLAHLLRPRRSPRLENASFAAMTCAILAGAWYLCPTWFDLGDGSFSPIATGVRAFTGRGLFGVARGLWHFEPLLAALAIAGLALRARRKWIPHALQTAGTKPRSSVPWLRGREDVAILAVQVLPYLAAILLLQGGAQRYFLPLLPWVAMLAAWSLGELSRFLERRNTGRARRAIALAPAAAVLAFQAFSCSQIVSIARAPDISSEAARWIERELDPSRARIAVLPLFDLPLARDDESLRHDRYLEQKGSPWARHQGRLGHEEPLAVRWKLFTLSLPGVAGWKRAREQPLEYLRDEGAEYVVLELGQRPLQDAVVQSLRSVTTLVARFRPEHRVTRGETPFLWWDHQNEYEEGFSWILRLHAVRAFGSVTEIRRVPRAAESR